MTCTLTVRADVAAPETIAFARVLDVERFSRVAEPVIDAHRDRSNGRGPVIAWRVRFGDRVFAWRELHRSEPGRLELAVDLVDGDLRRLTGRLTATALGEDRSRLDLTLSVERKGPPRVGRAAEQDARAIRGLVEAILRGLFPGRVVFLPPGPD